MKLEVSSEKHLVYVEEIRNEMEDSAKKRGTGIAKRSSEYLGKKISDGNSIIAIDEDGTWAGFCYIETWTTENMSPIPDSSFHLNSETPD